MNNFTKYICAGLAIALLIIQAIMIWGLYGNFSGSLNCPTAQESSYRS